MMATTSSSPVTSKTSETPSNLEIFGDVGSVHVNVDLDLDNGLDVLAARLDGEALDDIVIYQLADPAAYGPL